MKKSDGSGKIREVAVTKAVHKNLIFDADVSDDINRRTSLAALCSVVEPRMHSQFHSFAWQAEPKFDLVTI